MTSSPTPPSATPTTPNDRPTPGGLADKAAKLDLSATQIAGGALAAMTAAALGSRLGVGGTITGAALASIIAGVAGSLYTASLRHTRQKVATVLTSRKDTGRAAVAAVEVTPAAPQPSALASTGRSRPPQFPWKTVLAAAVATFAVALVALTGLESLAGVALSGGKGTTIEQVTKQSNKQSDDGDKGSDEPTSSSTPEPSDTESAPTEDASPTATEEPSPSATTGDESEPDPGPSDDSGQGDAGQGDPGQSGSSRQSGDDQSGAGQSGSGQSGNSGQSGSDGQSGAGQDSESGSSAGDTAEDE